MNREAGIRLNDYIFKGYNTTGMIGDTGKSFIIYFFGRKPTYLVIPDEWENIPVTWEENMGKPIAYSPT